MWLLKSVRAIWFQVFCMWPICFFSLETVRNFFLSQHSFPPPTMCLALDHFFKWAFSTREAYFSLLTHLLVLTLWYFSLHHFMFSLSGSPVIDILDSWAKSLLDKEKCFFQSLSLSFFVLFFHMMPYTSCFRFSTCFLFWLTCFFLSCSLTVHFFFILSLFHSCNIFRDLSLNKKEILNSWNFLGLWESNPDSPLDTPSPQASNLIFLFSTQ